MAAAPLMEEDEPADEPVAEQDEMEDAPVSAAARVGCPAVVRGFATGGERRSRLSASCSGILAAGMVLGSGTV